MQTIGERLEEARKRKGVSLREAAEATKIRGDYLQKLESNKFDLGLSAIYLRGFLRGYALYLKLPADKLVSDFDLLDPDSPRVARPINREVYGRMEFGAADAAQPRAEPPAPAGDPAHKPAPRAPHSPPKNFRPLPGGDSPSSRTMLFHLGKLLGGVLLVIVLAVWGIWAAFSSKSKTPAPADIPSVDRTILPDTPAVPPSIPANQAVITALDAVRVQVWAKINDGTPNGKYGAVLLPETALARGETRPVPKTGALYIFATAPEKIQIDTATLHVKPADFLDSLKGSKYFALP